MNDPIVCFQLTKVYLKLLIIHLRITNFGHVNIREQTACVQRVDSAIQLIVNINFIASQKCFEKLENFTFSKYRGAHKLYTDIF